MKLLALISSFFIFFHAEGVAPIAKTITVDQLGNGDYKTINEAIAAVPDKNTQWIKIKINAGVYREKVNISRDKGFIVLEGDETNVTSIEWGDFRHEGLHVGMPLPGTTETATFTSSASDTVFRWITFKNTYNNTSQPRRAVAALLQGDRASLYGCGFIGFQDTLADSVGRHYFRDCYIEGYADFIFGFGQSIYENCKIKTAQSPYQAGYVTAQGRTSESDPSGFVFKSCILYGHSKTYLGRAWGPYSRVVFYDTHMSDIVVPQGWDNWDKPVNDITYAESNCKGDGAAMGGRVKWETTLSPNELDHFINITFIDNEGWLQQQP